MKSITSNKLDFSVYKLVIFDLDNTIFNEFDYLDFAYIEIAQYLHKKTKSPSYNDYYNFLKNKFKNGGRTNLFDKLIDSFKLQEFSKEYLIRDFLNIMRTVNCKNSLSMKKGVYDILSRATKETQVCILTNGNVQQQQNKVKHINWKGIKIKTYYANEIKPKPSNKIFLDIISKDFNLFEKDKTLMVGDSKVDYKFASNINAEFILIDHLLKLN